jgi:hypothetical protein
MATSKTDEVIHNVGEFVSRLHSGANDKRHLFRGQNTDQPLLPKIIRLAKNKGISPDKIDALEKKMLARFRRESVPMLPILPVGRELGDWELMSIAQHWGMPTRLLDWTANPLASLWFAVSTDPPKGEDHGVVWMLEGPNEQTFEPGQNVFTIQKTCFFQPPHLDRRVIAQSGWFSVYRHNRTEFLSLENMSKYKNKLKRFIVPQKHFNSLLQDLRLLGINHASMFPDLLGLGAEIQAEIIDSWRVPSSI